MIDKNKSISFLEHYGLSNATIEPISGGLSSFTMIVTDESKKYVLKIYNKDSNIQTEVHFSYYLQKKGVPTAKIIKNLKGQLITTVNDLSGALFEFSVGDPIEWDNINTSFSTHLAKVVAKMHSLMLNNTRIFSKDYRKCKIDSTVDLSNERIIKKSEEIKDSIKNLNFSDLRKGLIHADLTRQNVLATKDRNNVKAIIDFGDAHYDYFAWDLAVLITHIYITKTYGIDWKALTDFIKKYYSLFPLTEKEVDVIISFIKIRNLNLAIEVNRSALNNKENINELISIENSVMTKLDLVEKNQKQLFELLKNNLI